METEGPYLIFLFPHQDDEYFVAPFLKKAGTKSLCFFLTRGEGKGIPREIRNAESNRVLELLGIPEKHRFFLPDFLAIPDLGLQNYLDQAFQWIRSTLGKKPIETIFCPAWEGGHPDHDAGYLLGVALGKDLNASTYEYPLYRSNAWLYPLFLAMSFPKEVPIQSQKLDLKERLFYSLLFRFYPSQWKTWIGLAPITLAKILFSGKFSVALTRKEQLAESHSKSWVYYEKRKLGSYSGFLENTLEFRRKYLL